MDIVVISNGLGNQMSQYALFLGKVSSGQSVKYITLCREHNGFELGNVFNIKKRDFLLGKLLTIVFRLIVTKRSPFKYIKYIFPWIKVHNENYKYQFDRKILMQNKGVNYYVGGWHDENYFNGAKEIVKETFKFKHADKEALLKHVGFINKTANSVAIHVRRGDYLNPENIDTFGKVCDESYYKAAIDKMNQLIDNPNYIVFSNDINWAKEKLGHVNIEYLSDSSLDSWMDMYLMSLCNNNIIANSTFSWWAAWLNKNKNKIIICPKKFILTDDKSDIYPVDWIRV